MMGQAHTRSFLNILRDRVRSTLSYHMKWIFNWYSDLGLEAAEKGAAPWFPGAAAGAQPYIDPWDPKTDNWPDIDKCNLNAAEYSVAKAARDTLADYIYRWRSRREQNVFWEMESTWPEFKTPHTQMVC